MSEDQAALPGGGKGLLRGNRTRSYGSLVGSPRSPVQQRRVEHTIQPGETLAGLALRYGLTMEEIKRANRLYTNDSVFLKKSLWIPVLSDLDGCSNGLDQAGQDGGEGSSSCAAAHCGLTGKSLEKKQEEGKESASSDLTPVDFLKRLDDLISQSKQAAVKGCEKAEQRVAALEAACTSRTSDWRPLPRSQSATSSSRAQLQGAQRAAALSRTKLTKNLRDREDEIFEL